MAQKGCLVVEMLILVWSMFSNICVKLGENLRGPKSSSRRLRNVFSRKYNHILKSMCRHWAKFLIGTTKIGSQAFMAISTTIQIRRFFQCFLQNLLLCVGTTAGSPWYTKTEKAWFWSSSMIYTYLYHNLLRFMMVYDMFTEVWYQSHVFGLGIIFVAKIQEGIWRIVPKQILSTIILTTSHV